MTIHVVLPAYSDFALDDAIPGACEMKQFWRSGNFRDLPVNPHVIVVVDWIFRMATQDGFARELAMLGTDHQAVMDQVLNPAENRRRHHLAKSHPLKLLHCLWRIGIAYGTHGGGDLLRPIADEEFAAARYIWTALLAKLPGRRPSLVFHIADSDFARATRIRLGNPRVSLDQEGISPAIINLATTADFTALPNDPDWNEIGYLALTIDGYAIADGLPGMGDFFSWFNPIWEAFLERNGPLPKDSLRLWLMLFACQRGYLRDRWTFESEDGSPSEIATGIRNLYRAFRRAVEAELRNPGPRTPIYLSRPS